MWQDLGAGILLGRQELGVVHSGVELTAAGIGMLHDLKGLSLLPGEPEVWHAPEDQWTFNRFEHPSLSLTLPSPPSLFPLDSSSKVHKD